MGRVVIAGGTGMLGASLMLRLRDSHEMSALRPPTSDETLLGQAEGNKWACDLLSIPQAEIALAGAETVVMLAQARRPPARHTRAAFVDLDCIMADSVARAVKRCGVKRIVLFTCGANDLRLALLKHSGVPVSVLSGGGVDPVSALVELVNAPPGTSRSAAHWLGERSKDDHPRMPVCSVQRHMLPAGWNAEGIGRAYFHWLAKRFFVDKVEERCDVFAVYAFGARRVVLRHLPGQSEPDSFVLQVINKSLANEPGRFEFRVLLDGSAVMTILVGMKPRIPWLMYRLSQALIHEYYMKHFGIWLAAQRSAPKRQ